MGTEEKIPGQRVVSRLANEIEFEAYARETLGRGNN